MLKKNIFLETDPFANRAIDSLVDGLQELEQAFSLVRTTPESVELWNKINDMKRFKQKFIEDLERIPLHAFIQNWLTSLNSLEQRKYNAKIITELVSEGIIQSHFSDGSYFTLGALLHIRPQAVLDCINKISEWSEQEKDIKIAGYNSLISFINEISFDHWKRSYVYTSVSSKYESLKVNIENLSYEQMHNFLNKSKPLALPEVSPLPRFSPIKFKQSLTLEEWDSFIQKLSQINHRDSLIARTLLTTEKRISEIIELKINDLDFEKSIIKFHNKVGTLVSVHANEKLMNDLMSYVDQIEAKRGDSPYVFITRNNKPLTRNRLNFSFSLASKDAKIKNVTPELIRASAITFKAQGQNIE